MIDPIAHIRPAAPLIRVGEPAVSAPSSANPTFSDELKRACAEAGCRVKFSGHAESRASNYAPGLSGEQLARLDRAVDSASSKGALKALVMLDDLAMIVGVKTRTVITFVDGGRMRDNVFTAIDAAVIA